MYKAGHVVPISAGLAHKLSINAVVDMAEAKASAQDWSRMINKFEQRGRHHQPFADSTQNNLEFIEQKWEGKRCNSFKVTCFLRIDCDLRTQVLS